MNITLILKKSARRYQASTKSAAYSAELNGYFSFGLHVLDRISNDYRKFSFLAFYMLQGIVSNFFKALIRSKKIPLFAVVILTLFFVMFFPTDAYAQANDITAGITALKSLVKWMKSMGIGLVTMAFMFIGYKMVFGGAQWKEIAPVFWGAIIVAGAGLIAASLAPELSAVDAVIK